MTRKEKKHELRKKLLERRSSIPEGEYLQKSSQICERLSELEVFKQTQTIHCYVSMNDRREVNTHPLLKQMLASDKKVVLPITQTETGILRHVYLEKFEALNKNKWGVLEPVNGEEAVIEKLSLVIVPMVGGDNQKNRIGYGKGFYDRFLKQVDCPTVGLLFNECLVQKIPVEPFDVSLGKIITEDQIIE
jgi:5-formyltetrahydrofolate cyclo-ligase